MITCAECRYAVENRGRGVPAGVALAQRTVVTYECHLHPPLSQGFQYGGYQHQLELAVFPVVLADDWCADGEAPR